jgi:hypothetical protein
MSTIFAGLWLADNIGSFFEGGGAAFYHSPIQPQPVQDTCQGPATWSNFVTDKDYNITGYTSLYFAARLINVEWAQHKSGVHQMFPSTVNVKDADGNELVTSYALHRPDGNWAIMLVNRDETQAHTVRVEFAGTSNGASGFSGQVAVTAFGSEQYEWKADGVNSHADPDGPAAGFRLDAKPNTTFTLPKASVTVVRGNVKRASK